ncbi:MAG TPA: farnesyl diphosphate synthase, partial [Myxococcota bacterium]|nr:farnesyl diphosphate synthase [Myxococcota bacterium]
MNEASLAAWLEQARADVDATIDRLLPDATRTPALIVEAMRYSVFAGGKRLRPMLVLAAAEAVGARTGVAAPLARRVALPAACAIELIHTYSLVHDDLPAMDNDTLRRGRPTAHVVYGEGTAILSGDALLTEAFAVLAREPRGDAGLDLSAGELAARKLAVIELMAEAAGAGGMVGGQALDLQAAAAGAAPLDAAGLGQMHAKKTGALLRASAAAGALMAGADAALLSAIDTYGWQIGLAFQIVDDILDVEGVSAVLGKTAGKDAAAGKPTYPALYGLDESRRQADACVTRAIEALDR